MHHATVARRGVVLRLNARAWLLWDPEAMPWCMPIVAQHTRRLRTDVPVRADCVIAGLPRQAPIIRAGARQRVETDGATVLGDMPASMIALVQDALRRAAESERVERRHQLA
jgi:hypothetical protein